MQKYILLFSAVLTVSAGQLFLKKGVDVTPPKVGIASIIKTLFTPYIILGFFFYGVSAILSLFVLQKFPLSIALPFMSLTYVIIVFTSWYFFAEKITPLKLLAVFIIMIGVTVLSRSNG